MASSSYSNSSGCFVCGSDPSSSSHVFRKVAEKASHVVYYTIPSKVKVEYPADAIIAHYDHILREKSPKRRWVWVFDGTNFDTDHIMELKTGQGIAELLKGENLTSLAEIKIINPTVHLKVLLKVIKPFMEDALKAKLTILDDRSYSVLEFI